MQTSAQNEYNNSLRKYIFINSNAYPITRYRTHYTYVTFSRSTLRIHSKLASRTVYIFHHGYVSSDEQCSGLNRLHQSPVNSHRCVTVAVVVSDENFAGTIRQVHFACTRHGNYTTWMRRDALVSSGSVQRKRIVQFGPRPSFPRMDDVQRARAHIPAGQKRVKGSLYLDHLQFESLTSARKLDDVSNYPMQKPPLPTKYDIRRPDIPRC